MGAVIGQGDPCSIKHLEKKIPDQPVGFIHLVKEEDSPCMGFQDLTKATRHPGLITKEELYAVEMLELRHIEPVERSLSEKITGAFQGKLGLSDTSGTKE